MAGSSYGTCFTVTTWGESHGPALGVVIDGCPAGLALSEEILQPYLDRRRPGGSAYTSKRRESDKVEILSGVYEGKTTGTPISLMIRNEDAHSQDYAKLANVYRPGHADYTYDRKYGFRDPRGGGRSSGRETAARVAAGAVAQEILKELGISIKAFVTEVGGLMNEEDILFLMDQIMEKGESVGGVIECRIEGVPAGIGEPVFAKLDAELAKAMMSIGAVKGVEIGDGFSVVGVCGSVNNDTFVNRDGQIGKETNHAGGILGGISDGDEIVLRVAMKPTPSVAVKQKTVDRDGNPVEIEITGRHDPFIGARAVPVVEAMAAIVLVDQLFAGMHAKIENVKKVYQ